MENWAEAIIGKGSGTLAFVTTGEKITTLSGTRLIASPLETLAGRALHILGDLGLGATAVATWIDLSVHAGCAVGNQTSFGGIPPPLMGS